MRRKLICGVLLGSAMLLAGCGNNSGNLDDLISTTSTDATELLNEINSFIASQPAQDGITIACSLFNGGGAAWQTWTGSHTVSDTNATDAKAAKAGADALCSGSNPQNTVDAIQKVVSATVAILVALHTEEDASPATTPTTTTPATIAPADPPPAASSPADATATSQ